MSSPADIICVLDDELCVLKALGRLLASDGLRSESFCEPDCFLEYAREHPIRLALIDIRMPGMTGLEVMAELSAISPTARVIVMTGENDFVHRTAAMARGAWAFFLKPFDDEALLQAVREAMAPEV